MTASPACPREPGADAGPTVDDCVALLAVQLEQLEAALGDRRFRRARRALLGPVGRPAIDDSEGLAEMAWLLDHGRASTVEAAARQVAGGLVAQQSPRAAQRRLARKYRAR